MAGEAREIKYKFSATENVTSVAGRVHKSLKAMRKSEGAEALEEIAKLGRGAGALVVLEMLGRGIDKVADSLTQFRQMSKTGEVTWGEYIEAIAKGIPIYGDVVSAGRKLRAEIDGTNEAVEKTLQSAKAGDLLRVRKEQIDDLFQAEKAGDQRLVHQELKAKLVEIKSEREQGIRAVRDALDTATADPNVTQDQRAKFRRQAGEQSVLIEHITHTKRLAAIEADRVNKAERLFSISEQTVGFLKQEAELGKGGTGFFSAGLQVLTEYAKKREEIATALKYEDITPEERAILKGIQSGLGRQEADTIQKLRLGEVRFSGGVSPTEQSSFLTGVGAAGRENNPAFKIAVNTDLAAKALAKLVEFELQKQNAVAGKNIELNVK